VDCLRHAEQQTAVDRTFSRRRRPGRKCAMTLKPSSNAQTPMCPLFSANSIIANIGFCIAAILRAHPCVESDERHGTPQTLIFIK
jgi:hypothetical protein